MPGSSWNKQNSFMTQFSLARCFSILASWLSDDRWSTRGKSSRLWESASKTAMRGKEKRRIEKKPLISGNFSFHCDLFALACNSSMYQGTQKKASLSHFYYRVTFISAAAVAATASFSHCPLDKKFTSGRLSAIIITALLLLMLLLLLLLSSLCRFAICWSECIFSLSFFC